MPAFVRAIFLVPAALSILAAGQAAAQTSDASLPSRPIPYGQLAHPKPHPQPKPKPKLGPKAAAPTPAPPPLGAPVAPTPPAQTPPSPAVPSPAPNPPPPTPALPPPPLLVAAPGPVAAGHGARLAPGQALPPAELEAFVDAAARQALTDQHVVGAVVAVVQNGQVVLEKGYGLSRLVPARPVDPRATLFRLGSVSKVLTWIEVLKGVEAGRLKLAAPIDAALPPALKLPAEGFAHPVRLDQLMTHSAGFEAREFGRLFTDDPARLRPLAAELARSRPRRVREPGELATYSNYGAALAGEAAAFTAHRPFEDLVEADLLNPMGLTSTSFREPHPDQSDLPAPLSPALAERLSEGFGWGARGLSPRRFEFAGALAPALSASSTADDMARLMLTLLAGGRAPGGGVAWGPATDAALHTPPPGVAPYDGLKLDSGFGGWTHGLMRDVLPGGFTGFGHDGATLSFRTRLVVIPQLGLGVFVATNTDTGARLAQRLPDDLVARFYAGADAPTAAAAVDAARYEGLYLSTRRAYHGLEGFVDRLTRITRVVLGPDGRLAILDHGHGREWLATDVPDRFAAADGAGRLAFAGVRGKRAAAYLDPTGLGAADRIDLLHLPLTLGLAAGVAALAALLTVAGPFVRTGREDARQTPRQTSAQLLQLAAACLWITALLGAVLFFLHADDPARLMFGWPDPWLVAGSWAGLSAAALSLLLIFQIGGVWRHERRLQGWTAGRKLRHTLTTLVFVGFAVIAAAWGALEPWSV